MILCTLGQASKLAKINQRQFQFLLGSREISVHYDVAEFESDLKTLHEMGRLSTDFTNIE